MSEASETICTGLATEFPALCARFEAREAVGLARYGVPLDPFDGRNWISEAREELADALVYLTAAARVLSAKKTTDAVDLQRWARIKQIRRAIAYALEDMERV